MKTLLIVEDEKAIRMGIRAIVRRAPVEIGTVLDCKNGAEAWEVLQSRHVDVMITDIRMPKMDGVELVRRSKNLPDPPVAIIISGYDDFNYAVEAFRQGVRDYLLKPIERECVFELLVKLDAELEENGRQFENSRELQCQVYRSLMLGGQPAAADGRALSEELGKSLFTPYVVICVPSGFQIPGQLDELYIMRDMDGHQVLLARADALPSLRQNLLRGCCAGISGEFNDPARLCDAYREAVRAREYAFLRGSTEIYAGLPAFEPKLPIEEKLTQIIQLLGASRIQEVQRTLEQALFLAQNGKIDPRSFSGGISGLPDRILEAYGFLLEGKDRLYAYRNPWLWDSAFEYCLSFQSCIADLFPEREAENENDGRVRIFHAIQYIRENFRSDINMAAASNYVSMNYTQFSYLFKEYTGSNFLMFLKNLRLEEGKKLLAATDFNIRKIARASGFKSEKHFMKSFKQSTGVSPSDYRRNINLSASES